LPLLFDSTLEYAMREDWNCVEHMSSWSVLATPYIAQKQIL